MDNKLFLHYLAFADTKVKAKDIKLAELINIMARVTQTYHIRAVIKHIKIVIKYIRVAAEYIKIIAKCIKVMAKHITIKLKDIIVKAFN
jgi:hypothetical protein